MSGNGVEVINPTDPLVVKLTVRLHKSGKMMLDGPIENKPMMLFILEMAKDMVKEFKVVIPPPKEN